VSGAAVKRRRVRVRKAAPKPAGVLVGATVKVAETFAASSVDVAVAASSVDVAVAVSSVDVAVAACSVDVAEAVASGSGVHP
jgi:hypothetical protein